MPVIVGYCTSSFQGIMQISPSVVSGLIVWWIVSIHFCLWYHSFPCSSSDSHCSWLHDYLSLLRFSLSFEFILSYLRDISLFFVRAVILIALGFIASSCYPLKATERDKTVWPIYCTFCHKCLFSDLDLPSCPILLYLEEFSFWWEEQLYWSNWLLRKISSESVLGKKLILCLQWA